ncbi:MAG: FecR family protein [Proteobacteria bacterium]|nr:FecR family protein [Pseudomonadota bacterium]
MYRALLGLLFLVLNAEITLAQNIVGVTSGTKGKVSVRSTDGSVRALAPGTSLRQNDVIRTDANGITELLFLDQTVMIVGPQSQLRLNNVRYQPNSGGKFLATLSIGVARFFAGVQPDGAHALKTPAATISARGAIFDVLVEEDKETTVILRHGVVGLRNKSSISRMVQKPGLASTVRTIDEAPSDAERPTREKEQRMQALNELAPANISLKIGQALAANQPPIPSGLQASVLRSTNAKSRRDPFRQDSPPR